MFFKLENGDLLNLNHALRISILPRAENPSQWCVAARFHDDVIEVLYEGDQLQCRTAVHILSGSLGLASTELFPRE